MPGPELLIASHNIHKIREFRSILKQFPNLDILSLLDFPSYTLPKETGQTFEENAKLKAKDAAQALGKWTLADDSGLVVPALKGAPGIYSRRYAGENASDTENRRKLLSDMKELQDHQRVAYFECSIALSSPFGIEKCVRGLCEGTIITEERGNRGFGYDAIFVKHEYGKTFAELDEETKNRISHRRKALDKLLLSFELMSSEP